jgi:uncharacterized protein
MKYLLVAALIAGIVWLLRRSRERPSRDVGAPQHPPDGPGRATEVIEVVACSVCQVHLPKSQALIGRQGSLYCCEAHRREAGG